MSVLSRLSVLVLVFVDLFSASESRRATERQLLHLRALSLRISVRTCPSISPRFLRGFSGRSSRTAYCFALIIQVEGQNKKKKKRWRIPQLACVRACVCICVCAFARGWRLRERRRCCREQKHFADVAGKKKERMESSAVISRTALSDSQRYATCGPVPIQA